MNKSLFFLVFFVCLAFSEDASIVSLSDVASDMNLCGTKSVFDESCIPKKLQPQSVYAYDDENDFSFEIWQAFHYNETIFPYQIEDIYFMVSASYFDEDCLDDPSSCALDRVTISQYTSKPGTYNNGAKGCPKYTLIEDKMVGIPQDYDDVPLPPHKSNNPTGLTKIHLSNPINVTSPYSYIRIQFTVSQQTTDSISALYVFGSKEIGNTYCNPHMFVGVLNDGSENPFESVFVNAHISEFKPQSKDDVFGWTADFGLYDDEKCDCDTGATDLDCLKHGPISKDCTGKGSVCWNGECVDAKWEAMSNPVYGQDFKACDPKVFGIDGKCDLGCGENKGEKAYDPQCFFGLSADEAYPGASRECDRATGICGPEKWICTLAEFNDGNMCNCLCGAQDPDCDNLNLSTTCPGGNVCEDGKCTVPKGWTCEKEKYDDGKICDCECGAIDPDCYIFGVRTTCPSGQHCSSKAVCINEQCGDGEVSPSGGEQCDGGNHCEKSCKCETHYESTYPPGPDCQPICGDGFVMDGEECDGSGGCLLNCTCDIKYTPKDGKCTGCGNGEVDEGEDCDGGENCVPETCKCKSGYQSEAGTNGCTKKSNLLVVIIVSVAVAVVVIAAACVIVFVIVPIIHRKREANSVDKDGDIIMEPYPGSSPGGETTAGRGTVSPLNNMCVLTANSPKVTAAPFVGQRNYIKETWFVNPEETTFNTGGLDVEVGATQQQVFELKNLAPSQMQFSVNVPRSNKFLVTAFPEKGAVASGTSTTFKIQITLYCNVELDQVPFAVSVQFDGEEKNQQYVLVPMTIRAQRSNRIDYDDLVFEETVGEGSFGSVWRGKYQNQIVAIKTLRTITESALKDFLREIEMLAQFNNPYIMGYFGSVITNDKLCMVIEFLSMGSLSALLKQYHLSPRLKTRLALDSVKGLAYLHTLNIMHRDIKPGNVLVSSFDPSKPDAICKIADFGTSRVLNGSAEDQAALQKGLGTPLYMAPEILGSNKTYTQSADVYSFGIMLAHIWNEKAPYSDLHFDTPWALANYVSSGNRPQIEEGCPQAYYQLMTQCWQADPSQRPSFDQCVEFLEQLSNLFAEQPEEPDFVHYTQKLD